MRHWLEEMDDEYSIRDGLAVVGAIALAALALAGLYGMTLMVLYDPVFDRGFQAGRASAVRDCAGGGHRNQCVMP